VAAYERRRVRTGCRVRCSRTRIRVRGSASESCRPRACRSFHSRILPPSDHRPANPCSPSVRHLSPPAHP
jgi:hypothetical protein